MLDNESSTQCRIQHMESSVRTWLLTHAEQGRVIERGHRDLKFRTQNPPSVLVMFLSCHDRDLVWSKRDMLNKAKQKKTIFFYAPM